MPRVSPRSCSQQAWPAPPAPVAHAAWPTPIALGSEGIYSEFNEGDLATADNLLNDVWPARPPLRPVDLDWPLSWTEDPYGDAYWRFYFYSLRPTSSLLWAYATTRDERYYRRLVEILSSFVTYDAARPFNRLTFDNNHAAAYRAMVLVNAYVKLQRWQVLPAALDGDLVAAIRRLGAFLAVPGHFEADFNHGFNEAAALLLIADNFPQFAEASAWRRLGVDRLLSLTQADPASLTLHEVTGATNPMQGWISRAYGAKTPSPALEYHQRGRATRLATLLATGSPTPGADDISQSDITGGRRIDVCGPAAGYTVTVTQEGTPSEHIAVAAVGCDAVASASAGPGAPSGAPAGPLEAAAPTPCRRSMRIPTRSGPRGELGVAYRGCRPTRLTVTVCRGGRLIARRSRRVAAGAGAIAIHGIRPGRVRVTARLGSARAVVRWSRIRDPKP